MEISFACLVQKIQGSMDLIFHVLWLRWHDYCCPFAREILVRLDIPLTHNEFGGFPAVG
jgi:hypothetical protein